jgi:hypothetical protein
MALLVSRPTFPLAAMHHKGHHDQPPTTDAFAVFDARGYWASLGGIRFQAPDTMPGAETMVEHVACMCNAAYEQGKAEATAEIRDTIKGALGIES